MSDIRVIEGETLRITCTSDNIPGTTDLEWLSPMGQRVDTTVESTMEETFTSIMDRSMTGEYTCKVTSKLDGSFLTETVTVTVQCEFSTDQVVSMHAFQLCFFLHCSRCS